MEAIKASQFPLLPEEALALIPNSQVDMHYTGAIIFALVGFFLVTGLELLSKAFGKKD